MAQADGYYGFELEGDELEQLGKAVFEKIGLTCIYPLEHVRLIDLDPGGQHSLYEHLEFDFLIPLGTTCLIGEITSRSQPRALRRKYRKFRDHYRFLVRLKPDEAIWEQLGVQSNELRSFRDVETYRGFFITTQLEEFDVNLSATTEIVRLYRSDWRLLVDYSDSIGSYAAPHFIRRFQVEEELPIDSLTLHRQNSQLMPTLRRKIASEVGLADVFTFEISPYNLLEIAEVYRRDGLNSLEPAPEYQRPLIPKKLRSIRRVLLVDPDFMFPNSILVVLSNDCRYRDGILTIPKNYGAISVIDGQHRLFSYADDNIRALIEDDCRIIVTAIKFRQADSNAIFKYSAQTFVEINTNQTRVARTHLDAIAYDILGKTTARAIAAKVILLLNEERRTGNALYGLFDTNRTGLGIIRATTILTSLKALTNRKRIQRLRSARSGARLDLRRGYEKLFESSIENLYQPETLIEKTAQAVERYFNLVRSAFEHDWPRRNEENRSSLRYAKVIAGFVKLFWKDFMAEGFTWPEVEAELVKIRGNLMDLRQMTKYQDILLDPDYEHTPNSEPRDNDNYRFLHSNRQEPTSIQKIVS